MKAIFLLFILFSQALAGHCEEPIKERNFQLGFITPFGTNGLNSHTTINKTSINLIGGYSYGNKALEISSLYNVNTHLTIGLQFSGMINYSGGSDNALQFAGLINIAKDGNIPFQFAGIINIAKVITGLQFATLVNTARKNSGVQFALFNYAEESDGVSIGLINIIKKGGKQELEVSFSEALNAAVNFKLGTDKLYTIFSAGINYINTQQLEHAVGIGFGTHIDWRHGWGNQIEAVGYSLTEKASFDLGGINMLAQLKLTVSKQILPHFKVFIGPVINMTISDYVNSETGALGSCLSYLSMWENNSDKMRLNGWIGFTAGIRL